MSLNAVFRLMVHVKYIASRKDPALWETTMTSMQRAVEAAMEQASRGFEPDSSRGLQCLDHSQFEQTAIHLLRSYSTYDDWKKAVSYPNEYGQTLAHLAVTLGYTRLLEQLISWEIDLSVRDSTGATALHFAYLYDHPNCVPLLTQNGTDHPIRDGPGRKPFAMPWPYDSDASFNGICDDSPDLASEHVGSITDREEMLEAERVLVPTCLGKQNRFAPRQATFEFSDLDLNPRSPTIDTVESSPYGVQPPGATGAQSIGMTPSISDKLAFLMPGSM